MKAFTTIFVSFVTMLTLTSCAFEDVTVSDYQSVEEVFTCEEQSLTYQSSDTGAYESIMTYGVSEGNYAIIKFDNVYDYKTGEKLSDYYGICGIETSDSGAIKIHSPKSFILNTENGVTDIIKSKYVSNISETNGMFDWSYYI